MARRMGAGLLPERVSVHVFPVEALGKVAPCGICGLAANTGWGYVGAGHDTARSLSLSTADRLVYPAPAAERPLIQCR